MNTIKEITVYAHGDSSDLKTWSNVPYFFTETLLQKGIRVNRVNINPPGWLEELYNKLVWRVLNKVLVKQFFNQYLHTWFNHVLTQRRIRKAVKQYPDTDVHLFLSFSHSAKPYTNKPVVFFCDWNIDYYFKYFLNRSPVWVEQFAGKRQDRLMEEADLVISLFPAVTDYLKNYYRNSNIHYLGNVVNSVLKVSEEEVLLKKRTSKALLFIGNRKYIEGAKFLIAAVTLLAKQSSDIHLHIIGMERKHFEEAPSFVTFHGYLNKSDEQQRRRYYELMQEARMVVNTTEKWGAFSSTLEAMYFFNPIITTPYTEFVQTFGRTISFGRYFEDRTPEALAREIASLLQSTDYEEYCKSAHLAVMPFTWDAYVDKVLAHINRL